MRIAIITIHNSSNYGANLQAYALQKYLMNIGYNAEIVNYDNKHMSKGLDLIRFGFNKYEIYYFLLDLKNIFKRKNMIKKFNEFSKKYLNLSQLYTKEELIQKKYKDVDCYISGSDQIWNPYVTEGKVDSVYFCCMAKKNERVISYASSCGGYDFNNEEYNEQIKQQLEKYYRISTRENNYIKKLSYLTNKNITKVLDPVFLLYKDDWISALNISKQYKKPYILIYAMAKHNKIINLVTEYYKNSNYDIIMINEPMFKQKNIHYVIDAGPREFVELFYNADRIVTNSFHGLAFSLIFQKQFSVINNARNMNRIYDLLNEVGAMESLSEEDNLKETIINYDIVKNRMDELIDKSKNFLREALE